MTVNNNPQPSEATVDIDDILGDLWSRAFNFGSAKKPVDPTPHIAETKLAITDSIQGQTGRTSQDSETPKALTNQADNPIVAYIMERRDYFANRPPNNGWSGRESGPCCDKCALKPEHLTGRGDAIKAKVGCRNPFQLATTCQCHIPTREAVTAGIVEAHNQLIHHFEGIEHNADSPETSTDTASLPLLDTIRRQLLAEAQIFHPTSGFLDRNIKAVPIEAINRICRGGSDD